MNATNPYCEALGINVPDLAVAGAEPWTRAQRAYVEKEDQDWRSWLVDEDGYVIDEDEIQLARVTGQG